MITSLLEKIWEAFLLQSIRSESAKFTADTLNFHIRTPKVFTTKKSFLREIPLNHENWNIKNYLNTFSYQINILQISFEIYYFFQRPK